MECDYWNWLQTNSWNILLIDVLHETRHVSSESLSLLCKLIRTVRGTNSHAAKTSLLTLIFSMSGVGPPLSGEPYNLTMPGQMLCFLSSTALSGAPRGPGEVGGSQEDGGDLWAYFCHKTVPQYIPLRMLSAAFVWMLLSRIPPPVWWRKKEGVPLRPGPSYGAGRTFSRCLRTTRQSSG